LDCFVEYLLCFLKSSIDLFLYFEADLSPEPPLHQPTSISPSQTPSPSPSQPTSSPNRNPVTVPIIPTSNSPVLQNQSIPIPLASPNSWNNTSNRKTLVSQSCFLQHNAITFVFIQNVLLFFIFLHF
jgi:hypothetical protein